MNMAVHLRSTRWRSRGLSLVVIVIVIGVALGVAVTRAVTGTNAPQVQPQTALQARVAPSWTQADAAIYDGVQERGLTLGAANAPITITIFLDMQCPACQQVTLDILPTLIRAYVRAGIVKLVAEPLTIIGSASVQAARMLIATSYQDLGWKFDRVFDLNAGQENSGYVTPEFLRSVAGTLPGVDLPRLRSDAQSHETSQILASAETLAARYDVQDTPALFISRGTAAMTEVPLQSTSDVQALESAIARYLHGQQPRPRASQSTTAGCSVAVQTCSGTS
jgi:protein-disulfide isomerase